MRLADIFDIERVSTSLRARDKESALRHLSQLFQGSDADVVYHVLREREALASTAIGSGVAVPHGTSAEVDSLQAALAISAEGVDFDAVDNKPAHIFVVLLSPGRQTGEHLKALARVSRILRDEVVRRSLLAAESPERALSILLSRDG